MCGIAGLMTWDGSSPPLAALGTLEQALSHRGPDGSGTYVEGGVGLAHTRLAIIDLDTGDQPLYGTKNTALVANGEIYNYVELRAANPDAVLRTKSDCELPLVTYEKSGADFVKPLRGMYAVALHDQAAKTLLLSRDPFGIKPLYYAETEQGFVFASEPAAILKSGLVARRMDPRAAAELLQLQFISGRNTIYPGIRRVGPGETLLVRGGRIAERRLRHALPAAGPKQQTEEEALASLERVLMDSVSLHQRSDVPYGMFLSGGIDSTALLVCMARLNGKPVRAFTAGFPDTRARDERAHAKKIARALGADHVEIAVRESDFWNELPKVVAALDDPVADYAALPTYLLGRAASKELKVVLCGEGGDELFGGYGRYRTASRSRWLGGRKMRTKGFLDSFGVLKDAGHWRDSYAVAERDAVQPDLTKIQQAQFLDCAEWLPNDLLIKVDRCLMAHGLEGRTPFLDSEVAEFAFRLPDDLKIRSGTGKYLLRRWLARALPQSDAFSDKRGFTVPVAEWMMPKASALGALVAGTDGIGEICNRDTVKTVFDRLAKRGDKDSGAACWTLLFYALWHRIHIEGKPVGDIFATLESR